jgi:UPF0716 protein FxsA
MFARLFLAFTITTAVELVLILFVGRSIGVWATIGTILVTGMLGAWLAAREGRRAWTAVVQSLSKGQPPADPIVQALLVLVGGVLLLTPGFLTDITGFACLIPPSRALMARGLRGYFSRRIGGGQGFKATFWSAANEERPKEVHLDEQDEPYRKVVDVKDQQ